MIKKRSFANKSKFIISYFTHFTAGILTVPLWYTLFRLQLYIHVYTMLYMLLFDITNAFSRVQLPYAIVGGYALALHGIIRATVDIDLVISLKLADFELAEKTLLNLSLKSRLPIRAQDLIKMRQEFIENRNLLAWSFVDYVNPSRQVDILIHKDLRKLKVETLSVSGNKIQVVTLEQLLQLKTEAGRPQDLIDIQNIKEKLREKK